MIPNRDIQFNSSAWNTPAIAIPSSTCNYVHCDLPFKP